MIFYRGDTAIDNKPFPYKVLCVRGEQNNQSLTDNGNGTVTDTRTGLIWQQGEPGLIPSWDQALSYCKGLNLANQTDWRLPNIKELESIADDTRALPAINTAFFPNGFSYYYWSSTNDEDGDVLAVWSVYFSGGTVRNRGKTNLYPSYVRCVRAGKSGKLSISTSGSGSGTIVSSPVGINCDGTCSEYYPINSTITLVATPSSGGSIFSGWSGDPDCSDGAITMSADISCTATFDFCQDAPVHIGTKGYNSIGDAYGDEYTGAAMSGDTIEIIASNQQETLDFAKGKEVTLKGGNDCQFAPLPYANTTITGSLTISTGSITLDRIAIH